ncbi:MAG: 50S ribosomal protein L11 methyltransferase [Syntrophales bacterium]|jgi:ribosomal protein L11 methyltransferase|nr:50S ribosomal protein L11 methyltransferase [Syntrophales bacterium]
MTEKGEMKKQRWMKLELSVPEELVEGISNFMIEIGAQGVYEETLEPWVANDLPELVGNDVIYAYLPFDPHLENRLARLQGYIEGLADLFPELVKVSYKQETIEDPDWGEQWKKYFKPLRVGREIVIKPTWERYAPEGGDIVIEIDPGMAFGTGQHASTRMCLEALEDVIAKDRAIKAWEVLDVGTGTGILGIACAKLGAEKVLCLDVDKKAVSIARENIQMNDVADRVRAAGRDVTTLDGSFDLIVANLTEKILTKLRPTLVGLLRPRGYLIISGIIIDNRAMIEESFLADPLVLHHLLTEKEWICYVLKKKEASR